MLAIAATMYKVLAFLGAPSIRSRTLSVSEARCRAIGQSDLHQSLDAVPAAVLTLDAGGRITAGNRVAADWFGHGRIHGGDLCTRDLFASLDGDPDLPLGDAGPTLDGARVTVTTVAGETIDVAVTDVPAGRSGHRLLWLQDDRHCRQLETQVRELQATVDQLNRACALGQLGAAIAHELNQPLAAAALHADVARTTMRRGDGAGAEAAIESTLVQLFRANALLRRLRTFAGGARPEMEWVATRSLIAEAEDLAALVLRQSGTTLTVDVDEEVGELLVDRVQVQQVLLNLILNAVDAVRGGERRELHLIIRPHELFHARLALRDSGPGIAESVRSRLFAPFATSKREGMGLGLAISRAIVEAHGGELWHEDGDGGACFVLTLRRRGAASVRPSALHAA